MHPLCALPISLRQFHQQVAAAVVDERMDRIKAQPVDAVFRDPVQCITDDEFPHSLRLGAVKIDCRPPWGLVTIAEKGGGVVIRYRHDLYAGDADFRQVVQLPRRRGESTLLCEAAYMHLIQHSFMPW